MYIKNIIYLLIINILFKTGLFSGTLLINEIAFNTSGDDWVELFYNGTNESLDISNLHVTMYYGSSEALSSDAVTIYSDDRPGTSWDDRFVIVHLTAPGKTDESDSTGDTNGNGCLDVYCDNYSGSLWTTDCVVSIDNDNTSSNGGIIDFAAYSNRDGTPNSSISSHVVNAQGYNEWQAYSGENIQECMIDIGTEELPSYVTISRKDTGDTNSLNDFSITKYMTPGRENILSENVSAKGRLFKPKNKKISVTSGNIANGYALIPIFIYESCSLRFRIFSSIGILVHESPLYDLYPGDTVLRWDINGKRPASGLYLSRIEAVRTELKKSQQERIYIIVGKSR